MYPASSSPRGGYIAIGSSSCSSACQNATLMSYSASTRECSPLVFLVDAALEMMILMHVRGAVSANVPSRTPWATSIATSLLRTSGPSVPSFISSSHGTSDLLASSRRDRDTLKTADVKSLPRTRSVDRPVPDVEPTVHPSCGHRLVSRRSHVWQHNSQESRQQGVRENTQGDRPRFAVVCFLAPPIISRDKRSIGRGYGRRLAACRRLSVICLICLHRISVDATYLRCR